MGLLVAATFVAPVGRAAGEGDAASDGPAPRSHPGTTSIQLVGSYPEVPVAPPAGSPLMSPYKIKRDCGFSVPLSGARSLWVFCDTVNSFLHSSGQLRFTYFFTSTAAIAYDDDPLVVHEAVNPAFATPRPYQFLVAPTGYWPCKNTTDWQLVLWPNSATRVPGLGGRDRVLIYFTTQCRPKGATTVAEYEQVAIGVAEWIHNPAGPPPEDSPIQATVLNPELFPIQDEGIGSWAEASVYGSDGFVYVFRCGKAEGCRIARAWYPSADDTAAYKYWDGATWNADPAADVPLPMHGPEPIGALNVAYLPDMGVWAMSGFAPPGGYNADVDVRVAPSLLGPWGPPATIHFPMCDVPPGCYAGHIHPSLSGPDTLGVSAFHWKHYPEGGGQVVAKTVRAYLDPPVPGLCQSGFFDVGFDHLFCKEIKWYGAEGITSGYPDGSYRPTLRTSRQVMAQWFHNWFGNPPVPPGAPNFSDVPVGHPFRDAIRWAASEGITEGYPDGTFRPRNTVARQTMAAWFYRLAGKPTGPFPDPDFTDVPPTHLFAKEIAWFAELGITKGYPDGTFRPTEGVSRQGVAAFFYRYTGQE